jgi:hypothetical protein
MKGRMKMNSPKCPNMSQLLRGSGTCRKQKVGTIFERKKRVYSIKQERWTAWNLGQLGTVGRFLK